MYNLAINMIKRGGYSENNGQFDLLKINISTISHMGFEP